MTTGRINQVTTVPRLASASEHRRVASGGESRYVEGALPEKTPDLHPARARSTTTGADHPIAPTGFPEERSASVTALGPRGPPAACGMRSPSGGSQPPVTPRRTVTGFGRPPGVLRERWPLASNPQTPSAPAGEQPTGPRASSQPLWPPVPRGPTGLEGSAPTVDHPRTEARGSLGGRLRRTSRPTVGDLTGTRRITDKVRTGPTGPHLKRTFGCRGRIPRQRGCKGMTPSAGRAHPLIE